MATVLTPQVMPQVNRGLKNRSRLGAQLRALLFFGVLDRYIFRQLFSTVLFGVLLFTIVWLAPETLFKLIQYTVDHDITAPQALTMFLYHIPPTLQQCIPMAVLFGALFSFRRLSLNHEMIAMFSHGVSFMRLLKPVLLTGLLFALLHGWVQESLTPLTGPKLNQLYLQNGLKSEKWDNFSFVEKDRAGRLEKFFLVGKTQAFLDAKGPLADFIILYYQPTPAGGVQISRILRAPTGQWQPGAKAWQLKNGLDYELNEEGVYREVRRFDEQWVNTSKYPYELLMFSAKKSQDMNVRTLRRYIKLLEEGGQLQDIPFQAIRLAQKHLLPWASVLFVVLGMMLGIEKARSSRHYSLSFGALVLFVYGVSVPFSTNLGNFGLISPIIVAAVPLLAAILATAGLLKLRERLT